MVLDEDLAALGGGVMYWSPQIAPPWSLSDLEGILDDALRVLEEIGVECAHEGLARRLAGWDGAFLAGDRVRFAGSQVRDYFEGRRISSPEPPRDGDAAFSLEGCWAGLNYCDPETQQIRPATSAEAAQMARLWDARGLSGIVPLLPGDVPPALATIAAERIGVTNSRYLGGMLTVTDPEEVRFLIDMNLAAGRRYRLAEQVGISPLRLNVEGLEAALRFVDDPDVDVEVSGFIPMAGATCPLDPRSAVVQAVAETLALEIVCAALGLTSTEGLEGEGLELRVEPFDFRYSSIVFGSPEWCLYRALVLQMAEYLRGRRERYGRFRSVAKRPNAQSACERTGSVLWQALLGVRHFGGVGQLSVDEVFSPQQAVLDREILSYVERVIAGLDLGSGEVDAVALIREGVEAGTFMGVADTAGRFRGFYHFPDIFRHWNLNTWRAEGEPAILDEAWARAREEMATSTFQLTDDQQKEVDIIYDRARRYLRV
jgi:trimethylamine:corrinoid methyltransferase-like protein